MEYVTIPLKTKIFTNKLENQIYKKNKTKKTKKNESVLERVCVRLHVCVCIYAFACVSVYMCLNERICMNIAVFECAVYKNATNAYILFSYWYSKSKVGDRS